MIAHAHNGQSVIQKARCVISYMFYLVQLYYYVYFSRISPSVGNMVLSNINLNKN
jgi:uncharacterized membrane protein (GlpM family)